MKKLITLVIVLMMVLSLAACGGNDTLTSSGNIDSSGISSQKSADKSGDSYEIKDINANNWTEVLKKNFGVEVTLPEGWTVKEVSSLNNFSNIKLFFNVGGSDTFDTFGETLFAACKTASTKDDIDKATFEESAKIKGVCAWRYYPDLTTDKGQVIPSVFVNYDDNGSNVEILFQR